MATHCRSAPAVSATAAPPRHGTALPLTDAQRELVARHLRLAYWVAARTVPQGHWGTAYDREDLLAAAHLGLCWAAQRYDPARGVRFSTFAVPVIRGTILSQLRAMPPLGVVGARGRRIRPVPLETATKLAGPDLVAVQEGAVAARELLDRLPGPVARVVRLRLAAIPFAEVARREQISVPTAKLRIRQARKRLQKECSP